MTSTIQFFIDLDKETMKRIDVTPIADGSYALVATMQFDAGWEKPETTLNFSDRKKLVRYLLNEGVPGDEIDAKL